MTRDTRQRAGDFLRFVAAHSGNPMPTIWGPYRCFDGYALAVLRAGDAEVGWDLVRQTLEMIDVNLAGEAKNANDKWHLADFALHPLLRIAFFSRDGTIAPHAQSAAMLERLRRRVADFIWHDGDLTENHNLLHYAGQYLAASLWPDLTYADGTTAATRHEAARGKILEWCRSWFVRGSTEWGADIYYNVNFLALYNLLDFAGTDADVRDSAKAVLDGFMLDMAVDCFAGTMVGASRRGYGCYRVDTRCSPVRALMHIYFGVGGDAPFNLNFIGGVIIAATSTYRPPAAVARIATGRHAPFVAATTHTVGLWSHARPATDHLSKHTYRAPEVMISAMNGPGGGGRYTEQVWQATLGEDALVFSNHPLPRSSWDKSLTVAHTLAEYDRGITPPDASMHRHWVLGNLPPGTTGEFRPGFWQGNESGPRSFGFGPAAFAVYDIAADAAVDWAHVFFPRAAFDEVVDDGLWTAARRGDAYVAVWLPAGKTVVDRGTWAGIEMRTPGPRCAVLAVVGRRADHATLADFVTSLATLRATWNPDKPTLAATIDGQRVEVAYEAGPTIDGIAAATRGRRFDTPWGMMPTGETSMDLDVDGERCRIGF